MSVGCRRGSRVEVVVPGFELGLAGRSTDVLVVFLSSSAASPTFAPSCLEASFASFISRPDVAIIAALGSSWRYLWVSS